MVKLSILIPAYENIEGLEKILSLFYDINQNDYEIIISDDSNSSIVENFIDRYKILNLKYIKRKTKISPIGNWNSLLDKASGKYLWILHHDDIPHGKNVINNILSEIESNHCIYILNTYVHFIFSVYRCHTLIIFKKFFNLYFLKYLIFRNYIGSPSSVILRSDVIKVFDLNIKFLVDIDWFLRILNDINSNTVRYLNNIIIYSIPNPKSITSSLNNINSIRKSEMEYLLIKNKMFLLTKKINIYIFLLFEYFSWFIFKIIMFLISIFTLIKV